MEAQRKQSTEEKTNQNSSTNTNSSQIVNGTNLTQTATFEDLWDKGEAVRKHSGDRRRIFEEFTNLLSERSVIEFEYAKNLSRICQSMKKLVQAKGDIANMISLYSGDLQVRVHQSMSLADNLREYVADYLKQILLEQEEYAKVVFQDGKKLERDLQFHLEAVEKTRLRYLKAKREFDDMQVQNQIYKLTSNIQADKKDRHAMKVSQTDREVQEFKYVLQESLTAYNSFIEMFYPEQRRLMLDLQKQEEERCERIHDGILKLLMFETSFFKNVEYQVELLGKNIDTCDLTADSKKFVSLNKSNKPLYKPIVYEQFVSFVDCSMQRINQQTKAGALTGEKNNELMVKRSIEENSIVYESPASDKMRYVLDIVIRAWNEQKLATEEYTSFYNKALEDIDYSNHFAYILQQFRIQGRFILKVHPFQAISYLIACSLNGVRDSKYSRQLLGLSFTYYMEQQEISQNKGNNQLEVQEQSQNKQQQQLEEGNRDKSGSVSGKQGQIEDQISMENNKNSTENVQEKQETNNAGISDNQSDQEDGIIKEQQQKQARQQIEIKDKGDPQTNGVQSSIQNLGQEQNQNQEISGQQNITQNTEQSNGKLIQSQASTIEDSSTVVSPYQSTELAPVKKIYLYSQIMHHHLWKSRDFWEAAIFDSAYEELKDGVSMRQHESQKESIMRERNACFGQLVSLLQNMLLFEIDKKEIKFLLQKFTKLFNLSEDQLKSLNITIDSHVYPADSAQFYGSSSSQNASFSN